MNLASSVSVGQLILALVVVLLGGAVTWGGLLQRVKTLEAEVEKLLGLGERMARVEEGIKGANSKLDQIVNSWLFQQPPGYQVGPLGRRP